MNMSHRVRVAGMIYAAGGFLWLALTFVLAIVFGGDPPGDSPAFVPSQSTYLVAQLLLLYGFFGVYWSGAVGRGMFGKIAFGLAVLGHILFVVGEVHSLVISNISDLVAVAALVSAIGLLLTGIAVLMAKEWHGWQRSIPLASGLYFWVFMFPFIFIAGEPNSFAVAGWGLVRLVLGLAIVSQAVATASTASRAEGALLQKRV